MLLQHLARSPGEEDRCLASHVLFTDPHRAGVQRAGAAPSALCLPTHQTVRIVTAALRRHGSSRAVLADTAARDFQVDRVKSDGRPIRQDSDCPHPEGGPAPSRIASTAAPRAVARRSRAVTSRHGKRGGPSESAPASG